MTLARGSIRGYDDDRMVLLFSMMDGTREVLCAVSGSAMDDLEHVPRTPADQREEQFTRLRDRIEACASRKFLAREFEGNPPCIIVRGIDFPANLKHARPDVEGATRNRVAHARDEQLNGVVNTELLNSTSPDRSAAARPEYGVKVELS